MHAVLAKQGVQVPMSDLFGVAGTKLLDRAAAAGRAVRGPGESLRRLIEALDFEIDMFAKLVRGAAGPRSRVTAVQTIPGVGPVAGRGVRRRDRRRHRFAGPTQLCLAGPG